jgi:hypothetical protein
LRRDHERPGNITAIVLVLDSKTGEDDARLQVVLVRFGADLEIVFASRLDDRRVNPICGSEVNVGELLVLVPDLHVCWFASLPSFSSQSLLSGRILALQHAEASA